jgi:23S rRNA (uridine2552-2'-O)-methyltransferase
MSEGEERRRMVRPPSGGDPAGRGGTAKRLKTAFGRTTSQQKWLERQLTDPFVLAAKKQGFRSRAAFKLIEIDDRFRLLRPGGRVVDLGAAPGGWTQVAVQRTQAGKPGGGRVVAIDLLETAAVAGATVLTVDFLDEAAPDLIREALDGTADVVLSDMAPLSSGHPDVDHLRIVALVEAAVEFAVEVLAPQGALVAKVWQGGTEARLLATMKKAFASVRHAKPPSSRAESAEVYVVATGFRGMTR